MNKQQLAAKLARQSHRSKGQAADEVDTLVYQLLKDLRVAEKAPAKTSPKPKGENRSGKNK